MQVIEEIRFYDNNICVCNDKFCCRFTLTEC